MIGQLDRLVSLSTMPTAHLGVVPFGAEYGKPPMLGFSIYDEALVRAETLTAELCIEEPQEVEAYLRYFAEYAELAVYGAEARGLITRIMAGLAASLEDRGG